MYRILAVLVTAIIIVVAACTKDTATRRLAPTLTTSQYLNLKSDSVTIVGYIIAAGSGFTKEGICYSRDTLPTTADNAIVYNGTPTGQNF